MLSKAKGQILSVAATMHVLFHLDKICDVIVDEAIKAAVNYMTCIQHTAYMTGRSTVIQEVEIAEAGMCMYSLIQI